MSNKPHIYKIDNRWFVRSYYDGIPIIRLEANIRNAFRTAFLIWAAGVK